MKKEAVDLFGQIVSANVASLAATTNALEASYQRQIVEWKRAYVSLWDSVEDSCRTVTTRNLENTLDITAERRDRAEGPGFWEALS